MPPQPPRGVSLCELFLSGHLDVADVDTDGGVSEDARARAEVAWAAARGTAAPRAAPAAASATPDKVLPPARGTLDVCCVCLARERALVFQPCFHLCVCAACAPRLDACPLCRVAVLSAHRVYH